MKKKLFYISYFLLMGLMICWLVFSNGIIGSSGENQIVRESVLSDYPQKDPVYYAVDAIQNFADMRETVSIQGWAYVETKYDNTSCKTTILLTNDSHCYAMDFANPEIISAYQSYIKREDVLAAYPDKEIYNDNVGYCSDFSTFTIKEGVYDVYIYRWENEENYGLVHTGKQFVKNGPQLEMRDWISIPLASATGKIQRQGGATGHLDFAAVENNMLVLKGWIFAEGKDCNAQTVYVHLQGDGMDAYYEAQPVARPDVAKAYDNSLYNFSGFHTSIAVSELPQGDLSITLMTQLDGRLWKGTSFVLVQDGNTVMISR